MANLRDNVIEEFHSLSDIAPREHGPGCILDRCFLYCIGNKPFMSLLSTETRASFLAICVLNKDSTSAMCVAMANWLVSVGSFKT